MGKAGVLISATLILGALYLVGWFIRTYGAFDLFVLIFIVLALGFLGLLALAILSRRQAHG